MGFIKRHLAEAITELRGFYPILGVTGPRQSGKTTLLKEMFPDYRYVSLERLDFRDFAKDDPVGFLKIYDRYVIFDEVQRVPELFPYLQVTVDEDPVKGRYILSGSQNFQLAEKITQSLAGRIVLFKLLPFDSSELKETGLLSEDWMQMSMQGFYPAIYDRGTPWAVFYANYLNTYVERDVRELKQVHNLGAFRVFLDLCAANAGQLLNLSKLGSMCGISQPTAKSWLNLLEQSYLVFLLRPYHENLKKRTVRHPKLYFYDTGLLSFLLGYRKKEDWLHARRRGQLFENLVVADVFKQNAHRYALRDYWFWREGQGREVDLLSKTAEKFRLWEIKAGQTISSEAFKNLDYFTSLVGEEAIASRTLVYGGRQSQKRSRYVIRPWYEAIEA